MFRLIQYLLNLPFSAVKICLHDYNMVTFHHNLIKKISFGIYKVQIKEQSWRSHTSWYQNTLQTPVFSTVWCWHKCRHTEQNRTESPEVNPHMRGQTIFCKLLQGSVTPPTLFFAFYLINSKRNIFYQLVESHHITII